MKLRHDEIRKKYGKNSGLLISVGRGWPGLPCHVQCRAVSAVSGVALQEHAVDHWSSRVFVPPSAFPVPVCL